MRVDRVSRWLLLCVCLVTWPALAQQRSAPRDLGKFFDDFTDEWVRRDPDLATATRYFSGEEQDKLEQQLTPNTRAWALERIALARRGLGELDKFDTREARRLAAAVRATDALDARVGRARREVHGLPLSRWISSAARTCSWSRR